MSPRIAIRETSHVRYKGAVQAEASSGLTSLYFNSGDHVYYVGSNQHMIELMWTGSAWAQNDLTADSGETLAAPDSSLTSLYFNSADHVYYIASNDHLDQSFWSSSWISQDLSGTVGAVNAAVLTMKDYIYLGVNPIAIENPD